MLYKVNTHFRKELILNVWKFSKKNVDQLIVSNVESSVFSCNIAIISEMCWTIHYAHIVLCPSFLPLFSTNNHFKMWEVIKIIIMNIRKTCRVRDSLQIRIKQLVYLKRLKQNYFRCAFSLPCVPIQANYKSR